MILIWLKLENYKKKWSRMRTLESITWTVLVLMKCTCLLMIFKMIWERNQEQLAWADNTWTMLKSAVYLSVLSEQLIGVNIWLQQVKCYIFLRQLTIEIIQNLLECTFKLRWIWKKNTNSCISSLTMRTCLLLGGMNNIGLGWTYQ